jgi:hypothetical protein
MGFRKQWNIADVARQINIARMESTAPQNDGFTQLMAKQDLYKIKWIVEDAIHACPNFGETEAQWLHEQEQKQILDILREDYNP